MYKWEIWRCFWIIANTTSLHLVIVTKNLLWPFFGSMPITQIRATPMTSKRKSFWVIAWPCILIFFKRFFMCFVLSLIFRISFVIKFLSVVGLGSAFCVFVMTMVMVCVISFNGFGFVCVLYICLYMINQCFVVCCWFFDDLLYVVPSTSHTKTQLSHLSSNTQLNLLHLWNWEWLYKRIFEGELW